jgi:hypothetical protein
VALLDDARVTVLLADYIAVDANGKLTAVGAAFTLTGLQPDGHTPPQHVAVLVDVPASHLGQDFSLDLSLRVGETGDPVLVPGPSGEVEPLRVAQVMRAQAPQAPGLHLPSDLPGRVQVVIGFPQGLPLAQGAGYRWVVELDGQTRPEWSTGFYVPGPPAGPVFGGPVGPTSIPNFPSQ